MIHAYNEQFFTVIQQKLAAMFELAVNEEHLSIDDFANRFLSSKICRAFETADPVYVLGKSANELIGIILEKEPLNIETSDYATPEYWVGWVLAFTQWYLNKPYKTLIDVYPCSKLVLDYFPYHEMDEMHVVDLYKSKLSVECPLKTLRKQRKFSQTDLALLSGVPVRTIKSYEQGTADIAKAQAETLYALAKVLDCTIEDLIK